VWVAVGIVTALGLVLISREDAATDYAGSLNTSPSDTAQDQSQAIASASANAGQLLLALDATDREVASSKQQVKEMLATLQDQERAVVHSQSDLRRLTNQQTALQTQLGVLEGALGGQQPITRADLQQSQRLGLLEGFGLGIIGSLAATFIWSATSVWRKRLSRTLK
jgi:chromosome segregation ATPase